jgi:hypothetical protein
MWWLKTVILATQEEEIRSTVVRGQPREKVLKTPFQSIKKLSVVVCT